VDSGPKRKVSKETAVFAIRTILLQVKGFKGHRAQIDFEHDPVTVGNCLTSSNDCAEDRQAGNWRKNWVVIDGLPSLGAWLDCFQRLDRSG